ncbi:MAG: DegQ family serine endoprotease [Thermodesulfovibrionales bacterium]
MILRKKLVTASLFTLFGIIFGLVISSSFDYHSKGYTGEAKISKEAIETLSKMDEAISEVAAVVKPSVVNISSTRTVKSQGTDSPFSKRFFGDEPFERPRDHKQSGLGSGVIVDEDGYILTNNHVIKDADEIKVKLSDQREFKGKVIGTDRKTDLAVIKVDAKNLPAVRFGDSDNLKVGSTVLAIGNPFGLTQTVTSGIVSATGRANVGIADYEDFIQTDAPINPGNSGGALVNIKGELVGINTAIVSTTGGYQGIGFAIPSAMAKAVMESLIKNGKVVRGWLGVSIQPLTPELAKQFNLKDGEGVLVGDVVEDSPSEKAGIQRGDVITEFDGKEVRDVTSLRNMVAGTEPDKVVKIKLIRDGKPNTMEVKINEMMGEIRALSKTFENRLKGVSVQDLTPSIRKTLDVPKRITGVIVTDMADDSPAEGILMREDIIMEINKKQIRDIKDYESVAPTIKSEEDILVLIYRKHSALYLTLAVK